MNFEKVFNVLLSQGVTQEQEDKFWKGKDFYLKLSRNQELDELSGKYLYEYMCECIDYERKRIGGDWVVAQAVPTRKLRDFIRKFLGNDIIFILLILEKETTKERLKIRHGDGEMAKAMIDFCIKIESFYEPKGLEENNTFDVIITNDMTPNDVNKKIKEIVAKA